MEDQLRNLRMKVAVYEVVIEDIVKEHRCTLEEKGVDIWKCAVCSNVTSMRNLFDGEADEYE